MYTWYTYHYSVLMIRVITGGVMDLNGLCAQIKNHLLKYLYLLLLCQQRTDLNMFMSPMTNKKHTPHNVHEQVSDPNISFSVKNELEQVRHSSQCHKSALTHTVIDLLVMLCISLNLHSKPGFILLISLLCLTCTTSL